MMKAEDYTKHEKAIDLIAKMLHLDPRQRITAVNTLKHEYVQNYVQNRDDKSFCHQYVTDWMATKRELIHSSKEEEDDAQRVEKSLKRKAMLQAAAGGDDDMEDDLYDMDDLLDDGETDAKRPKL